MQNQKILENKINIKFKNKKLLSMSLIHKSFNLLHNNEKLEFLGDRVLGLVLSKKLFNLYPYESEGSLDKKFASLVNRKICLKISKILELEKFLILGNAYKKNLKIEDKILSDALLIDYMKKPIPLDNFKPFPYLENISLIFIS